MKMLLTILLITAPCVAGQELKDPIKPLIDALCKVESNNNPKAVGDGGKAVGILQIWPIMVKDVNRILHKEVYVLGDRTDPVKSRKICRVYLNHYGKGKSFEYLARIWNGGPKGYKKECTVKYWKKVQKELKCQP